MNIEFEYLWSESYVENNYYLFVEDEKKCTYKSKIYGGQRVFLIEFFPRYHTKIHYIIIPYIHYVIIHNTYIT